MHPDTTRARTHIKALAIEATAVLGAHDSDPDGGPGALFVSGVVNGLAMAAKIIDGDTAEDALKSLDDSVARIVGRLYLDGQLLPPTAHSSPSTPTPGHQRHDPQRP
jgi:hypothetical protein